MTMYDTQFFVGRSETVARSAAAVVPVVMDLLEPRSVLDLGCGQGEWLEAFGLEDMMGVDIAYTADPGFEWLPPASYQRHDLTEPLDLGRTFDMVVCLEVGEHLPESAADTLIDSCVRHTWTVLWSAAVPGQEGKGHINCQPHEYWHAKFEERDFVMNDSVRPMIAGNQAVSPWYRSNTFLYLRR